MAGARDAAYPYEDGKLYAASERRPAYGDCGTSLPSTMLCAKPPRKSLRPWQGQGAATNSAAAAATARF
eukprot:scaffold72172_cov30-Phaeocystis_antarctica.AAC.1